jgi:hypothetical protein
MAACSIDNCPEEAYYKYLCLCRNCYSRLNYWKGRPRSDKVARVSQLTLWRGRMSYMIDNPRNVPRPRKNKKPKGEAANV